MKKNFKGIRFNYTINPTPTGVLLANKLILQYKLVILAL